MLSLQREGAGAGLALSLQEHQPGAGHRPQSLRLWQWISRAGGSALTFPTTGGNVTLFLAGFNSNSQHSSRKLPEHFTPS